MYTAHAQIPCVPDSWALAFCADNYSKMLISWFQRRHSSQSIQNSTQYRLHGTHCQECDPDCSKGATEPARSHSDSEPISPRVYTRACKGYGPAEREVQYVSVSVTGKSCLIHFGSLIDRALASVREQGFSVAATWLPLGRLQNFHTMVAKRRQ